MVNGIEFEYVSGGLKGYMKLNNSDKGLEKFNHEDFGQICYFVKSKLKGLFTWSTLYTSLRKPNGL